MESSRASLMRLPVGPLVGLLTGLVAGLALATEPPNPLHPPMEPPASAPASPADPVAHKGQIAFAAKCAACHAIGGARQLGPDLLGVTRRRDLVWLARWLKWPQQMMGDDAAAKALHDQWVIAMPDPALTDEQVSQILAYLNWADRHVLPRHKPQPPALTSMSMSMSMSMSIVAPLLFCCPWLVRQRTDEAG